LSLFLRLVLLPGGRRRGAPHSSAIGGAEPMLKSHFAICLNLGLSPQQLNEFISILKII